MLFIPKVTGIFVWIVAISGVLPFFSNKIFGQSSPACGCVEVNVTLNDTSCAFKLDINVIAPQSDNMTCSGLSVRVADNNPINLDTIDCAGYWTYGLFRPDGTLDCWGKVRTEDNSGPKLVRWEGRCGSQGNAGSAAGLPTGSSYSTVGQNVTWSGGSNLNAPGVLILDPATIRRDTFLCFDIEDVYNRAASWTVTTDVNFAGRPIFQDACNSHRITGSAGNSGQTVLCDCRTDVKVNDQIRYYTCNESGNNITNGFWALLTRVFTATDCMGNTSTVSQEIYFLRPEIRTLRQEVAAGLNGGFPYGANPRSSIMLDMGANPKLVITQESQNCEGSSQEAMLALILDEYYIFNDPRNCDGDDLRDDYKYYAAGDAGTQLQCNYSFDAQVVAVYPICEGKRRRVVVTTNYFDWCTGVKLPLDTIEIKDTYQPAQSLRQQISSAGGNMISGESSATLSSNQVEVTLGPDDCKPLQVGEMLKIFLERFYLFQNTGIPPAQNITFFEHETTFGYFKKWLDCSNSTLGSIIVAEVIHVAPAIATERKKVSVRVFQKDQCSGQETVLDENVLLK